VNRRWIVGATWVLLRHPALWVTAVRQVFVLARPGWWREAPRLPLPAPDYLHFRLVTAYGDPERPPRPADVVTYLRWCRDWRELTS
jgi:hypothetical protein